ncbi:hypothetical protein VNO77_34489 [Canavalia gladiata]|uniref:Uncharacterized protein n=1 Tax=Canavalia gladiata TaxID=3824 RepID=A0AAN9KGT9_CANGL
MTLRSKEIVREEAPLYKRIYEYISANDARYNHLGPLPCMQLRHALSGPCSYGRRVMQGMSRGGIGNELKPAWLLVWLLAWLLAWLLVVTSLVVVKTGLGVVKTGLQWRQQPRNASLPFSRRIGPYCRANPGAILPYPGRYTDVCRNMVPVYSAPKGFIDDEFLIRTELVKPLNYTWCSPPKVCTQAIGCPRTYEAMIPSYPMVARSFSVHVTSICYFKHLPITMSPLSCAGKNHTIHHDNSQLRNLRNEYNELGLTNRGFLRWKSTVEPAEARCNALQNPLHIKS